MPFGAHWLELVPLVILALLFFGPKRLPEMGSAIGKTIKEFQKSMREVREPEPPTADALPPAATTDAPQLPQPSAAAPIAAAPSSATAAPSVAMATPPTTVAPTTAAATESKASAEGI